MIVLKCTTNMRLFANYLLLLCVINVACMIINCPQYNIHSDLGRVTVKQLDSQQIL